MTLKPPSFEEIIAYQRRQLAQRQVVTPLDSLRALARMQDRPQDVSSYLREHRVTMLVRVMNPAARKLANPEAQGVPFDPVMLARRLVRQGAQVLVVSTNGLYHEGSIGHLPLVSNAVDVPVIRADYILEEYQVVETRAAGADGLIITPGLLSSDQLRAVISASQRNLMTVIAKVHDEAELRQVLPYEPRVIAIDNRNSKTGVVDYKTTAHLLEIVPGHISVMAMGGIKTPRDVSQVMAGVDGVLVNQELLLDPKSAAGLRALLEVADRPPLDPESSSPTTSTIPGLS